MLTNGAMPVPVAKRNSLFPGLSALKVSVPAALSFTTIALFGVSFCRNDVNRPFATFVE